MSDAPPDASAPLPTARASRPVWPGLVWAIPLAALLVVLFLAVHAFLNRGVTVVVSFDTAAGVKVGDTKVQYQGYEVGQVVKIGAAGDLGHHRIDLTIRLDHRAEPILRTGTVFWLVGAKTSLSDLSSVKAAFSGPVIGVAPSFEGTPTRRFRGLSEEPAVLPGTPGTPFVLSAQQLGSIRARSSINYRGQEVGKVTAVALPPGGDAFRVDVFVFKPYDRLVRPGTVFWPSSALKLALGAGGISATAGDPASLLAGGLQMDTPDGTPATPSPPGSHFTVFASREASQEGPPGPTAPYAMNFPGVGGDLAEGAPVTLLGFTVGEVISRALAYDPQTGLPFTRVLVKLQPERLRGRAVLPQAADAASLRVRADAAVTALLSRGYRAKLVQAPPLIGSRGVTLERVRGLGPAALGRGDPPLIPSVSAGDVSDQLSSILGKVDRIPIERIGQDVAAITTRLRAITASPKIDDSLTHLRNTLAQADRITTEVQPQVGPLVAKLRQAADEAAGASAAARGVLSGEGANPDASLPHAVQELSDAAASIRALADQLSRHPESLIRGRGKTK